MNTSSRLFLLCTIALFACAFAHANDQKFVIEEGQLNVYVLSYKLADSVPMPKLPAQMPIKLSEEIIYQLASGRLAEYCTPVSASYEETGFSLPPSRNKINTFYAFRLQGDEITFSLEENRTFEASWTTIIAILGVIAYGSFFGYAGGSILLKAIRLKAEGKTVFYSDIFWILLILAVIGCAIIVGISESKFFSLAILTFVLLTAMFISATIRCFCATINPKRREVASS